MQPDTGPDISEDREHAELASRLECLLRFAALMLRSGDAAFRVRQWMGTLARAMGVEPIAARIALGTMTVTARRGEAELTRLAEIAPIGVNAARIRALEHLARSAEPGVAPPAVAARLDAIERTRPLHPLLVTAAFVGAASGAFSYLNDGGLIEILASALAGATGQAARSLLLGRRINQYATTALCAMLASGLYCLLVALLARLGVAAPAHEAGFISSALFLVPGFPLVASLLDLMQHQTEAAVTRFAYAAMILLAGAFGLGMIASLAGLAATPPPSPATSEATRLLLRALASAAGGCGFAILYNSAWRTAFAVAGLALVGNELRLGLYDAGLALAPATLAGALAVGLLASLVQWCRRPRQLAEPAPRIALTVPGIIIMVPGTFAFQTVVFFEQGRVIAALHAGVLGGFVVGAMALGLAAARFATEWKWLVES
ncbi:MAG TPA: threonine/serine exporter family protein [Acetobacteraceae bacterium]|nr:threonine/serine exporter family protein [Acetobacteraceae bacterium]